MSALEAVPLSGDSDGASSPTIGGMVALDWKIHVTFPADAGSVSQDTAWLEDVAQRHNGRLDEYVMESFPQQVYAIFRRADDANAFANEVNRTRQWRASTSW